ncbi:Synaptophysin [Pseudolycoriella hygida]|uniref:Synaptophysin n=1 Tax=Pseudolycoriella hygida TaxID=35572 RepID=A0A9Q0S3V3_9DIPT|nr:Synaptophysin [Pseudolycoriella hygida]
MINYSLSAFQEPRGVMRILQFIFAIVAFSTTANFSVDVKFECASYPNSTRTVSYPFRFSESVCKNKENSNVVMAGDLSSDAQFYVATGVLSLLYCIFIIAVYAFIDEVYKSKSEIPLADFMLTTVLAIFWLSGSAAWANGTNALKTATDSRYLANTCHLCTVLTSSFSRLNISLIIGFLNFFLWASDLWFLYKETIWFQGKQANVGNSGTPTV